MHTGSCLPLRLVVPLSACDRSTVRAAKPNAEVSSSIAESTGQATAQDKPAVDPQSSGDQASGAPGVSGRAAKADPGRELTRQRRIDCRAAAGSDERPLEAGARPKSNMKN